MSTWGNKGLQQRGRLLIVCAGLFVVAFLVLVIWLLPLLLTEHPRIPKSADRQQAITNTRTSLAVVLTALGAAGGLAYTARTYRLGQGTYRLSREGQITDRYSKAVEQLGDDKIEVRLGGIYALERLMRDSSADQPTIMETLAAFVRQQAPLTPSATATPIRDRRVAGSRRSSPPLVSAHPEEDVQAVLTVLGRRQQVDDERPIDLQHTNFAGAHLNGANLTGANLTKVILTGADLHGANLTGAQLFNATLTSAHVFGANLTGAHLYGATLTGANLAGANLTGAHLYEAALTRANLIGANLTGARLIRANLTGAQLFNATLTSANFYQATLTVGALSNQQRASAESLDGITWVVPPSRQTR